jgi:RNA polymerase sigma-70 factor (ECF subfamily)
MLAAEKRQYSMLRSVDTAAPKPDDLVLREPMKQQASASPPTVAELATFPAGVLKQLYSTAEADPCGLLLEEFREVLGEVGAKHNYGLPAGTEAHGPQKEAFFRGLHLSELALAHGCARGKDAAWERFFRIYRSALTRAAVAITGSASLGPELADSLYAELYGLREADGVRRSPLASYSGRGSLQGWLRTTLVQRFRDHHRRRHRESPLEGTDCPQPAPSTTIPAELGTLVDAVAHALRELAAEDRFLLAAYFLDRQTLFEIARILAVHEATISRRLKRLVRDIRKNLLENLRQAGLSKRAAEEALGTDPRDLEINLRGLLQSSQIAPFSDKKDSAWGALPDSL